MPRGRRRRSGGVAQRLGVGQRRELLERVLFHLPDQLSRDAQRAPGLAQRVGPAPDRPKRSSSTPRSRAGSALRLRHSASLPSVCRRVQRAAPPPRRGARRQHRVVADLGLERDRRLIARSPARAPDRLANHHVAYVWRCDDGRVISFGFKRREFGRDVVGGCGRGWHVCGPATFTAPWRRRAGDLRPRKD
jgi:hypothetical protein